MTSGPAACPSRNTTQDVPVPFARIEKPRAGWSTLKRRLQLVDFCQCKVAKFSKKITGLTRYLIDPHRVYDPRWRHGNPELRLQITAVRLSKRCLPIKA
jgi:hypothetical protein